MDTGHEESTKHLHDIIFSNDITSFFKVLRELSEVNHEARDVHHVHSVLNIKTKLPDILTSTVLYYALRNL